MAEKHETTRAKRRVRRHTRKGLARKLRPDKNRLLRLLPYRGNGRTWEELLAKLVDPASSDRRERLDAERYWNGVAVAAWESGKIEVVGYQGERIYEMPAGARLLRVRLPEKVGKPVADKDRRQLTIIVGRKDVWRDARRKVPIPDRVCALIETIRARLKGEESYARISAESLEVSEGNLRQKGTALRKLLKDLYPDDRKTQKIIQQAIKTHEAELVIDDFVLHFKQAEDPDSRWVPDDPRRKYDIDPDNFQRMSFRRAGRTPGSDDLDDE